MAKIFDQSQAQDIIEKTGLLISSINNIELLTNQFKFDAINQITRLFERPQVICMDFINNNSDIKSFSDGETYSEDPSLLSRLAGEELHFGNSAIIKNEDYIEAIVLVDRFLISRGIFGKSGLELLRLNDSLVKSLSDLKAGINAGGFKRILMNSSKRQAAENAYLYLSKVFGSELSKKPYEVITELNSINTRSKKESFDNYTKATDFFLDTMKELVPSVADTIDPITQQLDKAKSGKSFVQLRNSIESTRASLIDNIKKSIDNYISNSTYKVLETIPLEDLNKASSGVRVKPLRDSGINNFSQIKMKSAYGLSDINGISDNSAWAIKRIVDDCYNKVYSEIKLKLNYDNKSEQTTEIVKNIFIYKSVQITLSEVLEECDTSITKIEKANSFISRIKNGYDWLSLSDDEKYKCRIVEKYLFYAYTELYTNLNSRINIDLFDNSVSAWNDFRKSPIEYNNIIDKLCPGVLGGGDDLYGLPESVFEEIQNEELVLKGIKCELRPYQIVGVKYILNKEKVLLGDEMGLGKTIQAIAAMITLYYTLGNHFMVICPASVLPN